MDTPKVSQCVVDDCAYNQNELCHAHAVTIGDGVHPQCDTFCRSAERGGEPDNIANVGACKVSDCVFNSRLECHASMIKVGFKNDEIDCLTCNLP